MASYEMKEENEGGTTKEAQGIRMNGYQQVLEMLQIADPSFRETILANLAKADPTLAARLRRSLHL